MANTLNGNGKLIPVYVTLLMAIIAASIAWGKLCANQEALAEQIENKASKEVFLLNMETTNKWIESVDHRLERIENELKKE